MTNQKHPITPPPELVQQWLGEQYGVPTAPGEATSHVATQAARWGADQELEACCELVPGLTNYLRAARRPKPPSLKEQALKALTAINSNFHVHEPDLDTIHRAIEQLPD